MALPDFDMPDFSPKAFNKQVKKTGFAFLGLGVIVTLVNLALVGGLIWFVVWLIHHYFGQ